MSAVPSLVGTGTVVAAAAAGLVVGQLAEHDDALTSSNTRKLTLGSGYTNVGPLQTRPGTSTAAYSPHAEEFPYSSFRQFSDRIPGPLSSHPTTQFSLQPCAQGTQATSPKGRSRRQSIVRATDLSCRPISENSRDSISSRDSWRRRFSLRPLSQHGSLSPRSSSGPDSPSLTFSHGSGAPILPSGSATPQAQPNKLVKRGTTLQDANQNGIMSRRSSRPQIPTLRRPATSRQRSATLQHIENDSGFSSRPPSGPAKHPMDQMTIPRDVPNTPLIGPSGDEKRGSEGWRSFFWSEVIKFSSRGGSTRHSESDAISNAVSAKRIYLRAGSMPRAYLAKATSMHGPQPARECSAEPEQSADVADSPQTSSASKESSESTPSKRARRSISMHFSSPTTWISRSGSLRRPKRMSTDHHGAGRRAASDPSKPTQSSELGDAGPATQETFRTVESPKLETKPSASLHPSARKRNSSSPLPPLARLPGFNIDVARLGSSSSASSAPSRPSQTLPSPVAAPQALTDNNQSRTASGAQSSTLASSDAEARDGFLMEDDEIDFKSETVFDSFRTIASSNRVRTVESPLDSMFDESPPSTAGNHSRTKRLSIQEILGRSWDGDTRIMEEEESAPIPIRAAELAAPVDFEIHHRNEVDVDSENLLDHMKLPKKDLGRLSLDDEDEEDWARDDENALSNHLSPPSSSVNSRGVSPTLRHALASISGNRTTEHRLRDFTSERPRSNIFDWCEPPSHEKLDSSGHSLRPKTVHGKQELDLRGGRPANRKGPSVAHVRSQSVPVVPENAEISKAAPKFGTWGLGTKVSEDWDDDFDFEEGGGAQQNGEDSATNFAMLVPASIQATQPTVKAHSGQIRELSLLVNDLKRLCRHGKDLDILNGSSSSKWKEAEDIIELASPDEEGETEGASDDEGSIDERFLEEGFDASTLEQMPWSDPMDAVEPEIRKTTVVRERQIVRRRSVFSPDDDIFGGNWLSEEAKKLDQPQTPDSRDKNRDSAVIANVIEAMQQQRAISTPSQALSPKKSSNTKLFFDTNSLQELVKRAGQLRDSLSDLVRRAELLTQSPAGTPRRERPARHNADGSPAFTRVFTDPASSPPKRLPKSHSTNSVLSRTSIDSARMQMMTVN